MRPLDAFGRCLAFFREPICVLCCDGSEVEDAGLGWALHIVWTTDWKLRRLVGGYRNRAPEFGSVGTRAGKWGQGHIARERTLSAVHLRFISICTYNMSRVRFPFRSTPSTQQVPTTVVVQTPEQKKESVTTSYWDGVYSEDGSKDGERLWGIENFGNTCYCNSVLQALYACQPFRAFVEAYPSTPPPVTPLGPPPGEANLPIDATPSSPLAVKKENPFDAPPTSPTGEKRGWKLGRKPTITSAPPTLASIQAQVKEKVVPPSNYPALPEPNPDQPPPNVFETIQTLFQHLSLSPPHQPLPSRKDPKKEAETIQTASLLAPEAAGEAAVTKVSPNEPQGPPLLASLPPPSAPRGGGPFSAGSLGRGVVRPEDVLKTIKRENEMFRGMAQQDAHEFLGWVLNKVAEEVEPLDRHLKSKGSWNGSTGGKTFVQNLFEGSLTNETRCLSCETVSLCMDIAD